MSRLFGSARLHTIVMLPKSGSRSHLHLSSDVWRAEASLFGAIKVGKVVMVVVKACTGKRG